MYHSKEISKLSADSPPVHTVCLLLDGFQFLGGELVGSRARMGGLKQLDGVSFGTGPRLLCLASAFVLGICQKPR
jgi:hypothetical protein